MRDLLRRRPARAALTVLLATGAVLLSGPAPVAAQDGSQGVRGEAALLESASSLESAGDLAGAESALREVLDVRPASVPALLALERVLRIQGRLEHLPALVEAGLGADPESVLLNRLLVRTHSELDQVEALGAAADRWIDRVPELEVAYREVARVWEARGEYARALEVLEEGRQRTGRTDALALDLGDLHAAVGDASSAVREWARAVDEHGRGLSQVRRRLFALPHGGGEVAGELVDLLAADSGAVERVDAALELAVETRLEERARAIAGWRIPQLPERQRRLHLDRLARHADAEGMASLAYWAYGRLLALEGARADEDGRLMALRQRQAELALLLGDTAGAAVRMERVEASLDEGSAQRRAAAATRIELLAAQDPAAASEALERFRARNPASPDLDRLTAAVAGALLNEGQRSEAAALLAEAAGPRSTLLRARLLLTDGEVAAARSAYMAAAPGLRGPEATRVLARVRLLGRISEAAGRLVGEALTLRDAGRPGDALDRVTAGLDALEEDDAPAVLAFAADLADEASLPEEAVLLRRRLVEDHPGSPEAPPALLAVALALTVDAETRSEARALLERLIIEYPRSALVPRARQALSRLRQEGVA